MNKPVRQHIIYWAALAASCLLLLIPAFYNHYPLVDPDAGTYIASGFKPETPIDRPITYGLLVRLFSLNGLSLWLAIAAQALIVSWLVFRIVRAVRPAAYILPAFIIMAILSLFTSLPWVVCMIHPDIFTSVGCLCVVLLVLNTQSKRSRIFTFILFFLSVAVHMSHPLLFTCLLISLFLIKRLYMHRDGFRRLRMLTIVLVLLSASCIALMGSALSKSKHVFFVATLLQKGILPVYLSDNCGRKDYKLCAYKDALPKTSDEFLWVSSSPLYKIGDWGGTKKEFNEITKDVLTTPKYLGMFIKASFFQFGSQAVTFNVGTGTFRFPAGSNVNNQMVAFLPHEVARFNNATQNKTDLPLQLGWINKLYAWIVALSVAALLLFFVSRWQQTTYALRTILIILITGCIINCADLATFSEVIGRYGCKMIWLLPLCAFVAWMEKPSDAHVIEKR